MAWGVWGVWKDSVVMGVIRRVGVCGIGGACISFGNESSLPQTLGDIGDVGDVGEDDDVLFASKNHQRPQLLWHRQLPLSLSTTAIVVLSQFRLAIRLFHGQCSAFLNSM